MLHALVDGERERARLDEQVVVRGCEVDVARLDRRLVLDVVHGPAGVLAEQFREGAARLRVSVLRDRDRLVDLVGDIREEAAEGLQPAPRCADADELVRGYPTLR